MARPRRVHCDTHWDSRAAAHPSDRRTPDPRSAHGRLLGPPRRRRRRPPRTRGAALHGRRAAGASSDKTKAAASGPTAGPSTTRAAQGASPADAPSHASGCRAERRHRPLSSCRWYRGTRCRPRYRWRHWRWNRYRHWERQGTRHRRRWCLENQSDRKTRHRLLRRPPQTPAPLPPRRSIRGRCQWNRPSPHCEQGR